MVAESHGKKNLNKRRRREEAVPEMVFASAHTYDFTMLPDPKLSCRTIAETAAVAIFPSPQPSLADLQNLSQFCAHLS